MGGHHKIYSHWKIYFKSLLLLLHTCHCFELLSLVLRGKVMWCVNCCDNTENISFRLLFIRFMCCEREMWSMAEAGSILVVFVFLLMTKTANFHCFQLNFYLTSDIRCELSANEMVWNVTVIWDPKMPWTTMGFNISLGVHLVCDCDVWWFN